MMLSTGQIATTVTGRECSPFPKVDCTSNRKAINTVKRVDAWLRENAIAEATAQGQDFARRQFEYVDVKNITQSDKDCMSMFLFGEN
jgi:hypothetical protein